MIEKDELAQFETRWKQIDELGFVKMLNYAAHPSDPTNYDFAKEEYLTVYSKVYEILMSKNPEIRNLCYQRLSSTLKFFCENVLEKIKNTNSLLEFVDKWNIYENIVLKWVLKVFRYLSRVKILIQRNSSLERELKEIFKKEVYDKIGGLLKQDFLNLLEKFRKREIQLDLSKMKTFINFLAYFDDNEFLDEIVNTTVEFYKQRSQEKLSNSYIEYLLFCVRILEFEATNLTMIVPSMTLTNTITKLNEILFFARAKELLEMQDGFKYLLLNKELVHLRSTFAIFSRSEPTLNLLIGIFKQFITEKFTELIAKYQLNDPKNVNTPPKEIAVNTNFLKDYSDFQAMILNLITNPFMNNNLFNVAFKEVLESMQGNQANINTGYLLPFYFDKFLRRSYNLCTTAQGAIDAINQTISIFPYVSDKDVFISIHKTLLSSRILNEDFVSMDAEKYLLTKLKVQCGVEYTKNIETMIGDYFLNKDINQNYLKFKGSNLISTKIEPTLTVLTAEHWPVLNVHKVKLPDELVALTNQMFKFYHMNYSGRTLQWALTNSMVEIETNKFDKKYTLICNTFQAAILVFFNEIGFSKSVAKGDIISLLKFEDEDDFNVSITPLISIGLLLQAGNGYALNDKFSNANKRVRVVNTMKSEEYVKKEKIEDDRSMAIDGTIIRIMKSRQRLEHNELVKMVLESLDRFKVKISTIKKRIDSLIAKELMSRDKDDANIYLYAANNN